MSVKYQNSSPQAFLNEDEFTANILPPPHNLELPIAKLMGDKSYLAFQAQRVALSLFPGVYVKFLPPSWNAPTPSTGGTSDESASKQKKEWKRRIKMYRKLPGFSNSMPAFEFNAPIS